MIGSYAQLIYTKNKILIFKNNLHNIDNPNNLHACHTRRCCICCTGCFCCVIILSRLHCLFCRSYKIIMNSYLALTILAWRFKRKIVASSLKVWGISIDPSHYPSHSGSAINRDFQGRWWGCEGKMTKKYFLDKLPYLVKYKTRMSYNKVHFMSMKC